ncbi:hypothetical protein U9M48_017836 [Paspalum notatum var. saurae]|uniref:Uncharacterized protein n=1 Tax=Paspalum notatum var. saurae TaxID=547442 RepID=A0AAQ3WPQ6_PASNO
MLQPEPEEEEFQEADILWPDSSDFQPRVYLPQIGIDNDDDSCSEYSSEHQEPLKLQVRQKASSPIDVPGRKQVVAGATGANRRTQQAPAAGFSKFGASHGGVGASSVVIGSHVFVPPHVIVDRRAKRERAMMMHMVPSGRARAARKNQMRE